MSDGFPRRLASRIAIPRALLLLGALGAADLHSVEPDGATFRLLDGLTAFLVNPEGKDFTLALEVRDLNSGATGPGNVVFSELLFKVYAPDGRTLVREVVPDDGIEAPDPLASPGGASPRPVPPGEDTSARLARLPARSFTRRIQGGGPGVYRLLLAGTKDLYVTWRLDPPLPAATASHTGSLHGHGGARRHLLYVPRGARGVYLDFRDEANPGDRRFTLSAPDGRRLFDGLAAELKQAGRYDPTVKLEPEGACDDQLLALVVSAGSADYRMRIAFVHGGLRFYGTGKDGSVSAVLAPDAGTARAVQGGALYHDGQVYWHPFQVKYHDWLKRLPPEDLVVRDAEGREVPLAALPPSEGRGWRYPGLPGREGFLALCGPHIEPPLCDRVLHDYPAHRDRRALNVALRDLFERPAKVGSVDVPRPQGYAADGLRNIAIGDHTAVETFGGNLAYNFGAWGWPYWRAAWRVLRDSEAPAEVKEILREALLLCGDRLAFGRGAEGVAGNALSGLIAALRYSSEATGDPLQEAMFETCLRRFTAEGFGHRTGIGRSGACHETHAYDHHYGTYLLDNFAPVVADLGDRRFQTVMDRTVELYSYTWCRGADANPWSSRTPHSVSEETLKRFGFVWKGDPGPDLTASVQEGDEWFVARRRLYYAVTYHGRLAPPGTGAAGDHRQGYGGGALCQVTVPARGPVIASTLRGYYGEDMELHKWRNFHLHSLVGELEDGRPLVSADSEHFDARLADGTVTSSGRLRGAPFRVRRSYRFQPDRIECAVDLAAESGDAPRVREAFEMLPFLAGAAVLAEPGGGAPAAELTPVPRAARAVIIDRGGYGLRVELEPASLVQRGARDTVLLRAPDAPAPARSIALRYRLVPFAGD
ncbi:MAG: hypothetical protein HY721_16790 [Planctomycetes bacterium]|nr:hypothetical protein [Planctomycetota bacterium]